MAIIQPLKKAFNWETVHEKIQDTPLYHLDWSATNEIEVNSWRGIIDIENFDSNPPAASLGGQVLLKLKGPQVATKREQFYVQITPYYDISQDAAIPYVMPVGFTVDVADIAIFNLSANGSWDAPFYLYYELGVNYKG
jgi:hypothetical protein